MSVSALFGLADRETRDIVRVAHDRAVREAFGHVERTAAAVRRGHGGARVEPASGLIAAAFGHRTSRAGDPQLHTHVLVANLGLGPDGRWSALDGRRLYAQARTASFLYQAVLRSELTRQLGVEWLTVRDGIAHVAGVPKPVMQASLARKSRCQECEFAAGDLVLIKRNEPRHGVTNGERGRVLTVDPARNQLRVALPAGAVTLDRAFFSTPTAHGDPSFLHGYAITCHVAHGLTVDRALVLGDDGLTSELAYTALSRGRMANHLYFVREPDEPRAEFAPATKRDGDPLDRLIATLRTSRATVLAIDMGNADHQRADAERELAHARKERAALERRRWRPGRRAELAIARKLEAAARDRVAQLTRAAVEQRRNRGDDVEAVDADVAAQAVFVH